MITVGRHVNRDELVGTALSTFIYADLDIVRSPSVDAVAGGDNGLGVRGRKAVD